MKDVKKSGFTLIELLGIIVLIAIIGLIAFVAIDKSLKSGKDTAYEKQIKFIELAAKNWGNDNLDKLPDIGKSITVDFMTLKMYGYLDVKVSDPITGLCFPNDAFVTITYSGATDQINYEVNRDSLNNGQLSCDDYSKDMLKEPIVTISGGANTLGKNQETKLLLSYNYENLDETKIHFKEEVISGNPTTASEFKIENKRYNNDKKLHEMDIVITGGWHDYAIVWIEIEKGAITLEDGQQSNYVSSSEIYIDNELSIRQDVDKSVAYICAAGACNAAGLLENSEMKSDESFGALCMDSTSGGSTIATMGEYYKDMSIEGNYSGRGSIYKGEQLIKLSFLEPPNSQMFYYVYRLLDDNDNQSSKLYKHSDNVWGKGQPTTAIWNTSDSSGLHNLAISVIENGTYYVEVCDTNNNCAKVGPYELTYNDCQSPELISGYNGNTLLKNLFEDNISEYKNYNNIVRHNSSNVSIKGAIIMPSLSSTFGVISNYYKYGFNVLEEYGYKIYWDSEIANKTLNDIINQANNDIKYCGNNYLYILASDQAGNIAVHMEKLNSIGNCSTFDPTSGESASGPTLGSGEPACDWLCKMQQNSLLWNDCKTDECKNQLHKENESYCGEGVPKDKGYCSFDKATGYWTLCNNGDVCNKDPLYDLSGNLDTNQTLPPSFTE